MKDVFERGLDRVQTSVTSLADVPASILETAKNIQERVSKLTKAAAPIAFAGVLSACGGGGGGGGSSTPTAAAPISSGPEQVTVSDTAAKIGTQIPTSLQVQELDGTLVVDLNLSADAATGKVAGTLTQKQEDDLRARYQSNLDELILIKNAIDQSEAVVSVRDILDSTTVLTNVTTGIVKEALRDSEVKSGELDAIKANPRLPEAAKVLGEDGSVALSESALKKFNILLNGGISSVADKIETVEGENMTFAFTAKEITGATISKVDVYKGGVLQGNALNTSSNNFTYDFISGSVVDMDNIEFRTTYVLDSENVEVSDNKEVHHKNKLHFSTVVNSNSIDNGGNITASVTIDRPALLQSAMAIYKDKGGNALSAKSVSINGSSLSATFNNVTADGTVTFELASNNGTIAPSIVEQINFKPTANNVNFTNGGTDFKNQKDLDLQTLATASDVDTEDVLKLTKVSGFDKGTLTFDGLTARYTPNPNETGTDTGVIMIDDQQGGTKKIQLTIANIDSKAPVISTQTISFTPDQTKNVSFIADEDLASCNISAVNQGLVNSNSVSGDTFTMNYTSPSAGGTFNNAVTFVCSDTAGNTTSTTALNVNNQVAPTWTQAVYNTGVTVNDATDASQTILDLNSLASDLNGDDITFSIESITGPNIAEQSLWNNTSVYIENGILKTKNLSSFDPDINGTVSVIISVSDTQLSNSSTFNFNFFSQK